MIGLFIKERAFLGNSGVAALEFALMAPVMTILLLGTIEVTNLIRVQAKVNIAAGQLAELVAGEPAVILGPASGASAMSESLTDLCAGAALSLLPYNTGALQASIGSVTVAYAGGFIHPVTDWTTDTACGPTGYHAGQAALFTIANSPRSLFTQDGTPYGSGSGSGTPVTGYSAISVQLTYTYANVLPYMFSQSIVLVATAATRPRSNATVSCTVEASGGGNPSPCPQNP